MAMSRLWWALALSVLVPLGIFAASVGGTLDFSNQRALASAFTQLSGIVALAMMAFAILLSMRPRWLERPLGGLDKMYRLHKWLAVGGLLIGIVHWLTATGSGSGHGPRPTADAVAPVATQAAGDAVTTATDAASGIASMLQDFIGPAHMVAEPALFILIVLVLVALIRLIPYRIFAKTHILVVPIFLVLAFHAIVLLKTSYWSNPVSWLTVLIVIVGVVGSGYALAHYVGWRRYTRAKVVWSHYYPEIRVLEAVFETEPGWPGHAAGQFAFVTTDRWEGAHPYTIATDWTPSEHRIGFIAKELGDHTAKLRSHLTEGTAAQIEGPYGCFTFADGKARQIWIGAGIGITPFIAKMKERATTPQETTVDLFHVTTDISEEALAKMRADADAAQINLHILISPRDGRLDVDKIKAAVPNWSAASVWFCGPVAFGTALRRGFLRAGLSSRNWHQELFQMR